MYHNVTLCDSPSCSCDTEYVRFPIKDKAIMRNKRMVSRFQNASLVILKKQVNAANVDG